MEVDNGENSKISTESTATITKEEILKGDVAIPVKDVFGFVIQHVAETYGQRMGVGSPLDRNILYYQQLASRKRFAQLDKYTFLYPFIVEENEGAPALISCEPFDQVRDGNGNLIDKKTFLVYTLRPKVNELVETDSLNKLNDFFQTNIRDRESEQQGLQFSHLLASILECHRKGYIHFTIEQKSANSAKTQVKWTFEYHSGTLYVYRIAPSPPFESIEMPTLSPWISTTEPYFKRDIFASHTFKFTEEDINLIINDPDVKLLQDKIDQDDTTEMMEASGDEHK